MAYQMVTRLERFLKERTGEYLRSIVKYENTEFDILYLRGDVADQYTEEEIEAAVSESIMDSIGAPVYEDVFSDEHGDLTCLVQCYENVVEMNFVLESGVGAVVAVDEEVLSNTSGLVANAREIVVEERG